MIFTPQKYSIEDKPGIPFIDPEEINALLDGALSPSLAEVEKAVKKSLAKERLSLADTAVLINASSPEAVALIKSTAKELKQRIYGNRIVLFAPLYIGNKCINNCVYCGFRKDNLHSVRKTLSDSELRKEVEALEAEGHKRLILVYGEHPAYNAEYIARTVREVYSVKNGNGEIRRVNINAAPFDTDGFKIIREAGIGTYQIFQETYHPETYAKCHPSGRKSDYAYRLTAMDRAMEAGIDDVGIGALLGLYDWRFELMALVRHTNHLEACFGVGPHTISFPRIKNASSVDREYPHEVSDEDFERFVSILRLAVPYTGLILTAREPVGLRDRLIEYGISQMDGGTNLEIGGYSAKGEEQDIDREQFRLGDTRPLDDIITNLASTGHIPSFCTACYRRGRTGEHFMEFSSKGFIKRFCAPNAILTFAEYLEDHGHGDAYKDGWELIRKEADGITDSVISGELSERLARIRSGERDILF